MAHDHGAIRKLVNATRRIALILMVDWSQIFIQPCEALANSVGPREHCMATLVHYVSFLLRGCTQQIELRPLRRFQRKRVVVPAIYHKYRYG